MKAGIISLTAVSLLPLALAQPAHVGHQHRYEARDVVTQVVTASSADAIVFVDQNGNPVSTSYLDQPTPTPQPIPNPAPGAEKLAVNPANNVKAAAVNAPPPSTTSTPPPPSSTASSNTNGGSALGINYSPYHADSSCKTADDINKDFDQFNGYGVVRSYGVDCDQVPNMISAAKSRNMKIMLGVFNIDSTATDIQTLIKGVGNDWDMVHSVSVGNEEINSNGPGRIGAVLSALQAARGALAATPFKGPVVTVDTFNAVLANPILCQNSDYAAINAHAFFDSDITSDQAGKWAQNTVQEVSKACNGKKTIITESGWPSGGSNNGQAVPSPSDQKAAIKSLQGAFPQGDCFLFSAYNDLWKSEAGDPFNIEHSWGIFGNSPN